MVKMKPSDTVSVLLSPIDHHTWSSSGCVFISFSCSSQPFSASTSSPPPIVHPALILGGRGGRWGDQFKVQVLCHRCFQVFGEIMWLLRFDYSGRGTLLTWTLKKKTCARYVCSGYNFFGFWNYFKLTQRQTESVNPVSVPLSLIQAKIWICPNLSEYNTALAVPRSRNTLWITLLAIIADLKPETVWNWCILDLLLL